MFPSKFSNNFPLCAIDDSQTPKDTSQTEENISRCKLASLFRLIDVKGWSQSLYNYGSYRCTQMPTQFYMNPFGLNFSELTASKILKLDFNGNIVDRGITDYGYCMPGLYLNSAILQARSDVNCIVHLHDPLLTGIGATKQGFLPVSVEALASSDISYYDNTGVFDASMCDAIVKALGPKNSILVLRNHGVVICGSSVEEVFFHLTLLMLGARSQMVAMAMTSVTDDVLVMPLTETCLDKEKIGHVYARMNAMPSDNIIWKMGEIEYEAEMRRLDLLGFRTGYLYKKKFHIEGICN